eukprot:gene15867-24246_t
MHRRRAFGECTTGGGACAAGPPDSAFLSAAVYLAIRDIQSATTLLLPVTFANISASSFDGSQPFTYGASRSRPFRSLKDIPCQNGVVVVASWDRGEGGVILLPVIFLSFRRFYARTAPVTVVLCALKFQGGALVF